MEDSGGHALPFFQSCSPLTFLQLGLHINRLNFKYIKEETYAYELVQQGPRNNTIQILTKDKRVIRKRYFLYNQR